MDVLASGFHAGPSHTHFEIRVLFGHADAQIPTQNLVPGPERSLSAASKVIWPWTRGVNNAYEGFITINAWSE